MTAPSRACAAGAVAMLALAPAAPAQFVTGPTVQHQSLTIDFAGPFADESDDAPNPFLDYRLVVTFDGPDGASIVVPGFFDGDGAGGGAGSVWRVRFTPPAPGAWTFAASFRAGEQVAIDLDPLAGEPASFDGAAGGFSIDPLDPEAPGFLKWGALGYAGGHYLKFADGPYWIKGGVDSPENWLGYSGFDNTPNAKHAFQPHLQDWSEGDPDWDSPDTPGPNDGRAIIGALNYLGSRGANSIYFLPMNIGGDAKDTWPYVGPIDPSGSPANDNLHFDVSKLAQWEIVFAHAQRLGIQLHVVLNEAEAPNKLELDDAELGVERQLFYREMVARFAHHNAIQWNISEEYNLNLNLGAEKVKAFAAYISAMDPYARPLTVHNAGNPVTVLAPFLGEADFDLTSAQLFNNSQTLGQAVEDLRDASADAGKPIPVMIDEPESITDVTFDQVRTRMLWDILLSGGSVEWYNRLVDQTWEDFREAEQVWDETFIARTFLEQHTPFWEMAPADDLLSGESGFNGGGEVLALPGEVYAVYLPDASQPAALDLSEADAEVTLRWFNPRTGDFVGAATVVAGGAVVALGLPPEDPAADWALLAVRTGALDCNSNGIPDVEEIADGSADDCDANGVPDECQPDCDADGQPDACAPDCNADGVPDGCEGDCDADGIPDGCEDDCDDDGLPDDCELLVGAGLVGTYFDGLDFTGERRARIDGVVEFDWGAGAPYPDWDGDTFTCRWTGWVRTEDAGVYTFATVTNDGARLWVDGVLLIDEWMDQSPTEHQGQIELEADAFYRIRMEHYEGQGTAVAELRWLLPGQGGDTQIIPGSSLAPALDADANGAPDVCDPACPADLDGSGGVDASDLNVLLLDFGCFGGGCIGDLDADGDTDADDLNALLAVFGDACPIGV